MSTRKRTRARGATVVEYTLCVMVLVAGAAATKKVCGMQGGAAADAADYELASATASRGRKEARDVSGEADVRLSATLP